MPPLEKAPVCSTRAMEKNICEKGVIKLSDKRDKEKTVYKQLGLGGVLAGGVPCAVDVKDDRIVRVRPLHCDSKYDKKQFNPWQFRRKGNSFEPPMKSVPSPFSLTYKKRGWLEVLQEALPPGCSPKSVYPIPKFSRWYLHHHSSPLTFSPESFDVSLVRHLTIDLIPLFPVSSCGN